MVELPGADKLEKKELWNYLQMKVDQQLIMKKIKLDMFILLLIVWARSKCFSWNMETVQSEHDVLLNFDITAAQQINIKLIEISVEVFSGKATTVTKSLQCEG